jgi:hypothetical protein
MPAASHVDDGVDSRLQRSARRIAEVIPAYLASCQNNVIVMLEAVDRADYATVTTLAHNMRGS